MKFRRVLIVCSVLLFMFGLYQNATTVREAFTGAMSNYLHRLLPVLFPFMVISRLCVAQDLLSSLSYVLPLHKIFRLPPSAMSVFWLGNLCGFPIGAQLTGILREKNCLTVKEAERLCALSGNVSPAFVVQAIGILLWDDTAFGGFLLGLQFLSCCIFGCILGKKGRTSSQHQYNEMIVSESFGVSICRAITESAAGCVSLFGYIVFFSVLLAVIPVNGILKLIIASVFEFTAGVEEAAFIGGYAGLFFTGFSIGWGGLCVLAQITHALGRNDVSLAPFIVCKLFQGVFCGLGAIMYGLCFPGLHKGEAVRSTLIISEFPAGGVGEIILPCAVVLLAGIHYWLHFRIISVKFDNSSV